MLEVGEEVGEMGVPPVRGAGAGLVCGCVSAGLLLYMLCSQGMTHAAVHRWSLVIPHAIFTCQFLLTRLGIGCQSSIVGTDGSGVSGIVAIVHGVMSGTRIHIGRSSGDVSQSPSSASSLPQPRHSHHIISIKSAATLFCHVVTHGCGPTGEVGDNCPEFCLLKNPMLSRLKVGDNRAPLYRSVD